MKWPVAPRESTACRPHRATAPRNRRATGCRPYRAATCRPRRAAVVLAAAALAIAALLGVPARSLASRFHLRFGGTPRVFRAPGRVNLIGEHTDYNDGFVLPAAIQFGTRVAIAPAPSRYITVRSENVSEEFVLDPNEREPTPRHDWTDYIRGVAVILQRNGLRVNSANVLIDGGYSLW